MNAVSTTPRPSPIAGMWYPGTALRLRSDIADYLAPCPPRSDRTQVIGLVVPHAGYRFSAHVAAHGFKLVEGISLDTVVIIGPLHQPISGVEGGILTSRHGAYLTPLGEVPVDHALLTEISQRMPLAYCEYDMEHSIEIELPFLQVALTSGFSLVPLMLRDQSVAMARQLGAVLGELLRERRALIVASSDLSHFYPADKAQQLDRRVMDTIVQLNADSVIRLDELGQGFACGRGAIAATIHAGTALGVTRAVVLQQANSGDVSGDLSRVVGYGSAALMRDG